MKLRLLPSGAGEIAGGNSSFWSRACCVVFAAIAGDLSEEKQNYFRK